MHWGQYHLSVRMRVGGGKKEKVRGEGGGEGRGMMMATCVGVSTT